MTRPRTQAQIDSERRREATRRPPWLKSMRLSPEQERWMESHREVGEGKTALILRLAGYPAS